ncbi:accessory gene regulator ArgB-like protein [Clostridium vincentii]|uniref:Putative accessory protein regulator protein n=1 Tax=Clostridium vincentii TaxID=52704 RepID=A0A2T0BKF0_9CLOT|nr:accessory gene regulator B family protein [Clostridium vincentii]PRR84313.1 putative accessory protein regulator protein [Clostridium vincentii]
MSLTEKIAVKIGNNAKLFLNADEDKEQVIVYGAINLIQTIFAVLWVIIASLFFGVLYEALIFSIVVSILRKYSGGVHSSSSSRCIIIGTILAVVAGISIDKLFYKFNMPTVIVSNIAFMAFAFIIVTKNAPVDSIKKPITNREIKKQFKKKSIIVIFIFSLIIVILCAFSKTHSELFYIKVIESISFGILWQSITLTKIGISILNKVDFVLKYIMEGGE